MFEANELLGACGRMATMPLATAADCVQTLARASITAKYPGGSKHNIQPKLGFAVEPGFPGRGFTNGERKNNPKQNQGKETRRLAGSYSQAPFMNMFSPKIPTVNLSPSKQFDHVTETSWAALSFHTPGNSIIPGFSAQRPMPLTIAPKAPTAAPKPAPARPAVSLGLGSWAGGDEKVMAGMVI